MIIVSNASPLIILAKLSLFDLPQRLFNGITISEDVWASSRQFQSIGLAFDPADFAEDLFHL